MHWVDSIFSLVWDIAGFFFTASSTVQTWVWPFYLLATPLYSIGSAFWGLLTPIAHFHNWVDDVWARVQTIISEFDIWNILAIPLNWAQVAFNWVVNAWWNVISIINSWWAAASSTVQGWIEAARQGLLSLINQANTWIAQLQEKWDNFWTLTFPGLATWTGMSALIDSALRSWFPFYDELVALWGSIAEFFTDPPQYVYNKLDEFFERFW